MPDKFKNIDLNVSERQKAAMEATPNGEYVEGDAPFLPTELEASIILGDIGHDSAHNDEV